MGSAALLPNAVKCHLVLQMNLNSNSESRGRSQMPKDPQNSQVCHNPIYNFKKSFNLKLSLCNRFINLFIVVPSPTNRSPPPAYDTVPNLFRDSYRKKISFRINCLFGVLVYKKVIYTYSIVNLASPHFVSICFFRVLIPWILSTTSKTIDRDYVLGFVLCDTV